MSRRNPSVGGGTSLAGFEYQFLATVWLALKLMFELRRCGQIVVEPASSEDVQAILGRTAHSEDAESVVSTTAGSTGLEIQIKGRNTMWTESTFRAVLQGKDREPGSRGPKPRERPIETLRRNPSAQFLFVTNAQIGPELEVFAIETIGERSQATQLPTSPAEVDEETIAPRIGILSELNSRQLTLEVEKMLRRHLHVPETAVGACREELFQMVRLRVVGQSEPAWRCDDIDGVARRHGGRLDPAQDFVAPLPIAELERQLRERHRVLLTGGPGVGKTVLAQELARKLQLEPEAFELVTGDSGIQNVRTKLAAPGACVFLIEDPWGTIG